MGCKERLGDFTILSTKNVDLTRFNTKPAEKSQPVIGIDKKIIIFTVRTGYPSFEEAADRAIEQGKTHGMALTNAVIYFDKWYIPYVYGEMQMEVKGNLVRVTD